MTVDNKPISSASPQKTIQNLVERVMESQREHQLKKQMKIVAASSQPGGRKAVQRSVENAQILSELEDKRRRMCENLKNPKATQEAMTSSPVKGKKKATPPQKGRVRAPVKKVATNAHSKPTKALVAAAAAKAKEEAVAVINKQKLKEEREKIEKEGVIKEKEKEQQTKAAASSATKRKTSTPRKVMLLADSLPLFTPQKEQAAMTSAKKSPNVSVAGVSRTVAVANKQTVAVVANQVSAASSERWNPATATKSVQKVYENIFGDISDSETDPTPVKKGEKEVFKTPKVEEKYQKPKRMSDGERTDIVNPNKKTVGDAGKQPKNADKQNDGEKLTSTSGDKPEVLMNVSTTADEKQLMGPPLDVSTSRLSLSLIHETDLHTPEAQIVKKKSFVDNVVAMEVAGGSSGTPPSSRRGPPKTRKVIEEEREWEVGANVEIPHSKPLVNTTTNAPRRTAIPLDVLPNDGSLEPPKKVTKKQATAAKTKKTKAEIVRAKATEMEENAQPAKKGSVIRDYFAKKAADKEQSVAAKDSGKSAFRIPRKESCLEEGEIGEQEEVNEIRRESKCPTGGSKNTKCTTSSSGRSAEGSAESRAYEKMQEAKEEEEEYKPMKRITRSKSVNVRYVEVEEDEDKEEEKEEEEKKKPPPKKKAARKVETLLETKKAVKSKKAPAKTSKSSDKGNKNTPAIVEEKQVEEVVVLPVVEEDLHKEVLKDVPVPADPDYDTDDSGSEDTATQELEKVTFNEDSSNYFRVVHDEKQSKGKHEPQPRLNPDKLKMILNCGGKIQTITVRKTEIFSLPGSNTEVVEAMLTPTVKELMKKRR